MSRKRQRRNELFSVELRIAGGISLFVRPSICKKILDGLRWCCDKRGLRIYEYTILPDRILMLANTAWGSLPEVIKSFKGFSSKTVILILRNGQMDIRVSWMLSVFQDFGQQNKPEGVLIWEEETQVKSLYTQDLVDQTALTILNRSVQLGLVHKPDHYLNCSAHPKNPLQDWIVVATDPWS